MYISENVNTLQWKTVNIEEDINYDMVYLHNKKRTIKRFYLGTSVKLRDYLFTYCVISSAAKHKYPNY